MPVGNGALFECGDQNAEREILMAEPVDFEEMVHWTRRLSILRSEVRLQYSAPRSPTAFKQKAKQIQADR
jgi:hypothetical protein